MGYKVLIPTAGTGSRLGDMTKYLNKSLISIANKPALARIIEMFPEDTEFVIPTGYKAELVKEFIGLAYPDRKFYFSDVVPFEGEGSGLGLSILSCKNYLQEPFVFCSCDTLVLEKIPEPEFNWMGYGERDNLDQYRTICINNNMVSKLCDKNENIEKNRKPYIGLAGIYNYKDFWDTMEEGKEASIRMGESFGLKGLVSTGIKAFPFTWFDTGVEKELENTREYFKEADAPNILEKANETIWFMKNEVIKFSDNTEFIVDRVRRAKMLKGFVPAVTGCTRHMYKYSYASGKVMSKCVLLPIFKQLLSYSNEFWKEKELDNDEKKKFQSDCMQFYKTKTYERVELFYKNFHKEDGIENINGVKMPSLKSLLDSLDWEKISHGLPGRFHGDYHFENILYDEESKKFTFLDWRQNFGNSIEIGDIYYDFGKMMHGLIVCHDLIAKDEYWIKWGKNDIVFDLNRKQILVECEKYFYDWLDKNGYDRKKVELMTALIYLNIAALHHHPYGLMLYALGKQMLFNYCRSI